MGAQRQVCRAQSSHAWMQEDRPANRVAAGDAAIAKLESNHECFHKPCPEDKVPVDTRACIACIPTNAVGLAGSSAQKSMALPTFHAANSSHTSASV